MTWRLVLGVVVMQRRVVLWPLVTMALFSRPRSLPEWIAGPLLLMIAVGAPQGAR